MFRKKFSLFVALLCSHLHLSSGCTGAGFFPPGIQLQDDAAGEFATSQSTSETITRAVIVSSEFVDYITLDIILDEATGESRVALSATDSFKDILDIRRPDKPDEPLAIEITCSTSGNVPHSIALNLEDTNNRPPSIAVPSEVITIQSTWDRTVPINWNKPVIVSDIDYDSQNVKATFSVQGENIPGDLFDLEEITVWDDANPRPVSYDKNLFVRIKPNADLPVDTEITVVITASDPEAGDDSNSFTLQVSDANVRPSFTDAFYIATSLSEWPAVGDSIIVDVKVTEPSGAPPPSSIELVNDSPFLNYFSFVYQKDGSILTVIDDLPEDIAKDTNNVIMLPIRLSLIDGNQFYSTIAVALPLQENVCTTITPPETTACPTSTFDPTTECPISTCNPDTDCPTTTFDPTTDCPTSTCNPSTDCPVTDCPPSTSTCNPDTDCPTTTFDPTTDCPPTDCTTTSTETPPVTNATTTIPSTTTTGCPTTCEPCPITTECPATTGNPITDPSTCSPVSDCPTTCEPCSVTSTVSTECPVTECPTTTPVNPNPTTTTPCPTTCDPATDCPTTECPSTSFNPITDCPTTPVNPNPTCPPCISTVSPPAENCSETPEAPTEEGSKTGLYAGIAVTSVIAVGSTIAAVYFFTQMRKAVPSVDTSWSNPDKFTVERKPPRTSFSAPKAMRASIPDIAQENGFSNPAFSNGPSDSGDLEQVLSHSDAPASSAADVSPYASASVIEPDLPPAASSSAVAPEPTPIKSALATPKEIDPDYDALPKPIENNFVPEKPRGVRIADEVEIMNEPDSDDE